MSMFEKICRDEGIEVKYYGKDFAKNKYYGCLELVDGGGTILFEDGSQRIFINQNKPIRNQKYVEAHELGHVLLGHLKERMDTLMPEHYETEANIFAAVFTAIEIYDRYRNGGK